MGHEWIFARNKNLKPKKLLARYNCDGSDMQILLDMLDIKVCIHDDDSYTFKTVIFHSKTTANATIYIHKSLENDIKKQRVALAIELGKIMVGAINRNTYTHFTPISYSKEYLYSLTPSIEYALDLLVSDEYYFLTAEDASDVYNVPLEFIYARLKLRNKRLSRSPVRSPSFIDSVVDFTESISDFFLSPFK